MKDHQDHSDEPGGEKKTGDHDCCSHGGPDSHHHHGHDHGQNAASKAGPGQWTRPMHPEIFSDQPGDCPKCGMALEQVPVLSSASLSVITNALRLRRMKI